MTSGFAGGTAGEENEEEGAAADEEDEAAPMPMPPLMERRCAWRWDRAGIGGSRSMADGSMDGSMDGRTGTEFESLALGLGSKRAVVSRNCDSDRPAKRREGEIEPRKGQQIDEWTSVIELAVAGKCEVPWLAEQKRILIHRLAASLFCNAQQEVLPVTSACRPPDRSKRGNGRRIGEHGRY